MKKHFLVALLLLGILAGCSAPRDYSYTSPGDQTAIDTYVATCTYTDMDSFLADWAQVRNDPENCNQELLSADCYRNTESMVVPVLKTDDYKLSMIYIDKYKYSFTYRSTENEEDQIAVYVRKIATFPQMLHPFYDDVVPQNGIVYLPEQNEWMMDNNGLSIEIHFPDSIVADDVSTLCRYFSFREYTADGKLKNIPSMYGPGYVSNLPIVCVSATVAAVAIGIAAFFLIRRHRKKRKQEPTETE